MKRIIAVLLGCFGAIAVGFSNAKKFWEPEEEVDELEPSDYQEPSWLDSMLSLPGLLSRAGSTPWNYHPRDAQQDQEAKKEGR